MSLLVIERVFPASIEKVFAFITEMENLLKWWGPEGTSIADHNLDLSKIGDWFFVLVDPMGGHHKVIGEVLAVDPPNSVEFTLIVLSEIKENMIDSVVKFELFEDVGGTKFVLTQTGLSDDQICTQSEQGWSSTLARLEKLINELEK